MRGRTLSESFALDLMREGKPLMRMHTVHGMRWFIVPGGQVTDSVAGRILARSMCSRATVDFSRDATRPFSSAALGEGSAK
jgi:hypothetical protein